MRGPYAFGYIDGRTPFRKIIKTCAPYYAWRDAVFARDNFTCQRCGAGQDLQAHHIKPFSKLLDDFRQAHPHLHLERDKEAAALAALNFKPLWDVGNGQTLCETCHAEHHPNIRAQVTRRQTP